MLIVGCGTLLSASTHWYGRSTRLTEGTWRATWEHYGNTTQLISCCCLSDIRRWHWNVDMISSPEASSSGSMYICSRYDQGSCLGWPGGLVDQGDLDVAGSTDDMEVGHHMTLYHSSARQPILMALPWSCMQGQRRRLRMTAERALALGLLRQHAGEMGSVNSKREVG